MINLDMVGRIVNGRLYVGGAGTTGAFDRILAAADRDSPLKLATIGRGGRGPSDHQSFSTKEVPVLFLFSGLHADYHTPGDDVDKINHLGIAQTVYLAFDIVRNLAAIDDELAYDASYDQTGLALNVRPGSDPSTATPRPGRSGRVQLGIVPEMAVDETVKGVLLDGVTPGTAAESVGMQKGDVLTRINKTAIPSLEQLQGFLEAARPGDQVTLTWKRGDEVMTKQATLKARPESN
jgi:membrane-associated protease RseP (regulator of RpoE activity)